MAGAAAMVRRLDVLVVNDSVETSEPLVELLRPVHEVRVANGLREAVDQLVTRVPDAIVCHLHLPPYRGDVLLAMVAREHPSVRRVLCIGPGPEGERDCLAGVAHVTLDQPGAQELVRAIVGDE
jgi:CheY-like chemotaxis protein